jgi:hypothetical protein
MAQERFVGDHRFEKVEDVVLLHLYVLEEVQPVYRALHESLQAAHEDGQKLTRSGVTHVLADGSQRFFPPHSIHHYHCFKAKKFTERIEKPDLPGVPKEIWHGHYEDENGNCIDF